MVLLSHGLRQGFPLYLFFYVAQGEVTTNNINQNVNIKEKQLLNKIKERKVFQYADNSHSLLNEEN